MGIRFKVFLSMMMIIQVIIVAADTNPNDVSALNALKSIWKNTPPSWVGIDPCGRNWEGITCNNNSRVISMKLSGINIEGSLSSDILSLSELQYLDLSNNKNLRGTLPAAIGNLKKLSTLMLIGCGLFGPIPDSIGSLSKLSFLALNSNNFNGPIPPSVGNLSSLSWLDVTYNKLTGQLPISNGTTSGLDKLVSARHIHLGQNQLSGTIPTQLFHPKMNVMHFILDNNRFSGPIPATLANVKTLEVVRLDWNNLNGSVPANLSSTTISELGLSNNNLHGSIPDLTGMGFLNNVDMSNNSFDPSDVPNWFTSMLSLTTLVMEGTQIHGDIPAGLFNHPQLRYLVLSNNQLNGSLNIGSSNSNQLKLVDLQNNLITNVTQSSGTDMNLKLEGNPICSGVGSIKSYCIPKNSNSSNDTHANNCAPITCGSDAVISPNCKCAHPYNGNLFFLAFNYSNLDNSSYYGAIEESFMSSFRANNLPVDSVSLGDPIVDSNSYLLFSMKMFPLGEEKFNRTAVSVIGTMLNRNPLPVRNTFGPFFFIDEPYCCFAGFSAKKSTHPGLITGVTIGCLVLLLLLIGAGIYAARQKKRAQRAEFNPFASWNPSQGGSGGIPQLKGARWFSYDEIKKCTDDFSESNCIGSGGYGKVYKGTIADGQLVAIKRAQQGSLQGANEFKTEIELLSRIHHKNVVNLVGFCYEQGEQMLVYEYVPNGTLKDSITGKSGIKLNWTRRLNIALDSAKGLSYMHELADPPIIHRDVKSTNILLDNQLNAKVADFGLCKLLGDTDKGYVSTQVKGTLGYMDPEYYMTEKVTDKSDVYSFGIVLLELLTGKAPIEKGKYIVRVVKEAMDKTKDLYNLHDILDQSLDSIPGGLNKFVDLAMSCVSESTAERPKMSEVVREIENILVYATSELIKTKSVTSSSSYDGASDENPFGQYSSGELFAYSGGHVDLDVEQR